MCRQYLHTLQFQMGNGIGDMGVSFDLYPAIATSSSREPGIHFGTGPNGMDLMDTDGIRCANDCGYIMGFMYLLQTDRQIRLSGCQHFANPRIALRIHRR